MAFDTSAIHITNFQPIRFPQNKEFGAMFDYEFSSENDTNGTYSTGGYDLDWEDFEQWPRGYKFAEATYEPGSAARYQFRVNKNKLYMFAENSGGVNSELSNNTIVDDTHGFSGRGYVRGRINGIAGA